MEASSYNDGSLCRIKFIVRGIWHSFVAQTNTRRICTKDRLRPHFCVESHHTHVHGKAWAPSRVMAAETSHQQPPEAPSDEPKPSDDASSNATGHDEPYEKTAEAEAGLAQPKPRTGPPGGPPPNGGLTAWLQVLGGFFLFFNTWVRICPFHCDVSGGAEPYP